MRLMPLLAIEEELTKKLFPGTGTVTEGEGASGVSVEGEVVYRPPIREVCVRAGSGWKGLLSQLSGNMDSNGA